MRSVRRHWICHDPGHVWARDWISRRTHSEHRHDGGTRVTRYAKSGLNGVWMRRLWART